MGLFAKKRKTTEKEEKKRSRHQEEPEAQPKKKQKLLDIQVMVGRAHSSPKPYTLNGDRSIMDALNVAGLVKKDSEIISVNGHEVEEEDLSTYELEDGDRVTLVRNVEGGNN